jgi:hypothetical protein
MESKNHGRDGTCPAGNGTAAGESLMPGAGIQQKGTGSGHGRVEALRQALCRLPRVHAGGIFLSAMNIALPVRLVKKIDRSALKITRGGYRRFSL